jgi:hypothetical protein
MGLNEIMACQIQLITLHLLKQFQLQSTERSGQMIMDEERILMQEVTGY